MKIGSERAVAIRYFGVFKMSMYGNECRVFHDGNNSTQLIPCVENYLNYLKRNSNSFVTTK